MIQCLRIAANILYYDGDKFTRISKFHITRSQRFDWKLADAGNPVVRQFRKFLCRPKADHHRLSLYPTATGKFAGLSRLPVQKGGQVAAANCGLHFPPDVLVIFLSCKADVRV